MSTIILDVRTLRKHLFKFYYRMESVLAPGLQNAQFAYRELLQAHITSETRWLDLGCGHQILPEWMPHAEQLQMELVQQAKTAFGLDSSLSALLQNRAIANRVVGNIEELPFADESLDLITANMVVEHITRPRALLEEARRVLRPNGLLLIHTPNAWSYATFLARLVPSGLRVKLIGFLEGRKEEDVFPTRYRMNSPRSLRMLAGQHRFALRELRITESSAQAVMLGPVVLLELFWIRMLRWRFLRPLRSNILAILQKAAMKTTERSGRSTEDSAAAKTDPGPSADSEWRE